MVTAQPELDFTPPPPRNLGRLEQQCEDFLRANPKFWQLFVAFAEQAIAKGHKHLSSDLIVARIRWENEIMTVGAGDVDGKQLKCNNNWTPYLARRFHREFPTYDGFFFLRKVETDK